MVTRGYNLRRLETREQGIALITTLLVVALIVACVVQFNRAAIADVEISKNFSDEKKGLYLAISAVNVIKDFLRLEGLYGKGDSFLDEWAKSESYFASTANLLEEGKITGLIVDESGKINVNNLLGENGQFNEVQKAFWERLLKQPVFGLSDDQVNIIVHGVKDWLDPDEEVTGVYGAESNAYRSRGYQCRNGPFLTVEELLLINGITPEIFYGDGRREGIGKYFTVFGGGQININTAPLPVLMALSHEMTEDIAMNMDKFRRDEANKWALGKKIWYRRVWPYANPLPEGALTDTSGAFSVYIRATLRDSVKEVRAIIAKGEDSATSLIFWQEM
ncbi:MAG: general secretion pathway protein GspK [Thermodesulfobacteriota bacterium]